MSDVTCLWDRGALPGERPVWVDRDRRLYRVDIKGRAIHRYDPGRGPETGAKRTWSAAEAVGAIQPAAYFADEGPRS